MNLTRVFDILPFQRSKYPNAAALAERIDGQWKQYSIKDCIQQVNAYSKVLYAIRLRKGDFLILCPELASINWLFLDLAALQLGGVVVPIHASFKEEQITHILQDTQARFAFVQSTDRIGMLRVSLNKGLLKIFTLGME